MLEFVGKALAQQPITNFPFLRPLPENTTFGVVALRIANWILILAAAIAVIYLIYGGVLYITAGGDAEKATKGRTSVVNAVIGIVIILLALVLINWVSGILTRGAA